MSEHEAFRVEAPSGNPVATVTLCQPDLGNQLTLDEIRALGRQIRELGSRPEHKLVEVRADGEDFCLGRKPGPPPAGPRTALSIRNTLTEPILDLYEDVRATPVPVMAVVQGRARGLGCAFIGACDLVVAAQSASFALPEMDKNLPPTLAISALLGKVPPKRLVHFVYTRQPITALEALAWGMISEVASDERLAAAAAETSARLADRDRTALCGIKEYMNLAPYVDPAASARLGANILSTIMSSRQGA